MKSRDVIGRKIVAVRQEKRPTSGEFGDDRDRKPGAYEWCLDAIILDNGATILFSVIETDGGEYEIVGRISQPRRRKATQ